MLPLKNYELYLLENEIRPNTKKNYMNTLKQLNAYLLQNAFPLDKEALIRFKDHLKNDEYEPGKKYKLKTINQKIVSVNIFLNWLEKGNNAPAGLTLKLYKTQTKEHRESVNEAEYKRLIKYANTEEMRLFILLIGNTGVRITEACSIRADDLNSKLIIIENKGKQRAIGIPQFLKKQLKCYVNEHGIDGEIFYKEQATYRTHLKTIAGKAKINKEKVYPHSLRHYFAKAFLENGGDSTVLQQLLGHENIGTTTIYTKLNTNELGNQFSKIKNT
ncbi:tyrosine-type recombinase/integrase [Enterococcus hulanensis]|uniref:tyrosine-type recombinase/integrase n=1 Tax=Enterococcus hulanensis TaxID=2559929 RepID=UPI002891890A|nr:tyrosine-type recombinase/integrase [Enterococcus hulanensis]MDT2661059.1 tyrosine-type recombinase/integrase [Enterococcus hulanensis]